MSKFVSIPVVWTVYECSDDVVAILGSAITTPPHIVVELMVAQGQARKIKTITTKQATSVEVDGDEDEDGDDEKKETPWVS